MTEIIRNLVIGPDTLIFLESVFLDAFVFVYVMLECLWLVTANESHRFQLARWLGAVMAASVLYLSYGVLIRQYFLKDRILFLYSLLVLSLLMAWASTELRAEVRTALRRLAVAVALMVSPIFLVPSDRLLVTVTLVPVTLFAFVWLVASKGIVSREWARVIQACVGAVFPPAYKAR